MMYICIPIVAFGVYIRPLDAVPDRLLRRVAEVDTHRWYDHTAVQPDGLYEEDWRQLVQFSDARGKDDPDPVPSWVDLDVVIGAPERDAPSPISKNNTFTELDCREVVSQGGRVFAWLSGPAIYPVPVDCNNLAGHGGGVASLSLEDSVRDAGQYQMHLMYETVTGKCNYDVTSAALPQSRSFEGVGKTKDNSTYDVPPDTAICKDASGQGRWIRRELVCSQTWKGMQSSASDEKSHALCKQPDLEGMLWVPFSCYFRRFETPAVKDFLRGKEVMMIGDSVMRFLFGALARLIDPEHPFLQDNYGYWKSPHMKWLGENTSALPKNAFDADYRNFPFALRDKDANTNVVCAMLPDGTFERQDGSLPSFRIKQDFVWDGRLDSFLWRRQSWDLLLIEFPLLGSLCRFNGTVDTKQRLLEGLATWVQRLKPLQKQGTRVVAFALHQHSCVQHCASNNKMLQVNDIVLPTLKANGIEVFDATSVTKAFYFQHPISKGIHPHPEMNDLFAQMLMSMF